MILGHKILLNPNEKQIDYFEKASGCSRLVWNIALEEWNRLLKSGEKLITGASIRKEFNQHKYEAFPWMKDLHRDAHSYAFIAIQNAFNKFFKNPDRIGFPKPKKKKDANRFYVSNTEPLRTKSRSVLLPRIGWIRMTEPLRLPGKIMGAVVSRTADRWFISIQVKVKNPERKRTANGIGGVDLGIKTAATLSTGEKFDAPKPLAKELKKLRRVQRKMSRQKKTSKNREKTKSKIARIYARVANIRKDFWHKLTTKLCRENQAVGIEDLNISGMMKNKKLSKALNDVSIGMFKPMMEYKSKLYGVRLVKADRFFPSSKKCSCCGVVKESLSLSERVFHCESCGASMDRDVNAAKNLQILAACEESKPSKDARLAKAIGAEGTGKLSGKQLLCKVDV
jgi:putative transposase